MKKKKGLISILFLAAIFFYGSVLAQPIISPVIQVSADELFDAEQVSVTIDQHDPTQLSAGSGPNYYYYSSNHGQSWQGDGIASSFGDAGCPSLTSDSKGNIYHAHLSSPPSPGYWLDRIVIQKSVDSGKHFSDGTFVGLHPKRQQFKECLISDRSVSSPYHDNLYLSWTEFDVYPDQNIPGKFDSSRILFSRSTDAGENWSSPIQISERQGDCADSSNSVEGATSATAPNGDIYLTWSGPDGLLFAKSTDGGKTFSKNSIINSLIPGWNFQVNGLIRCNGLATILCDISNSKNKGNIYVVFSDKRNGVNNSDIFMLRSKDGGNTWDPPVRVNNDTTQFEQFLPAATIDQVNGILYCVFYDRRNTNGGTLTDLYLAKSSDGGSSFTNYRITTNPIIFSPTIFFPDYISIAAQNSYIFPVWEQRKQTTTALYSSVVLDTDAFTSAVPESALRSDPSLTVQISPNPAAAAQMHIHFLHRAGEYSSLTITDVIGRTISTICDGRMPETENYFSFDAHALPNGIYYCIAQSGEERTVREFIVAH